MSCSDILLSFLADIGDGQEEWADHFQFLDFDATPDLSGYGLDVKAPLSGSPSLARMPISDHLFADETSGNSSPSYSCYSESDDDDAMMKIGWDFSEPGSVEAGTSATQEVPAASGLVKKRKATSSPGSNEYKKSSGGSDSAKKSKQTVEEKMATVCQMLRATRELKRNLSVQPKYRNPDPIGTVEAILRALLGSKTTSQNDLLKLFSPSGVLNSTALASLHAQAQLKRAQMNLVAWMPAPLMQSLSVCPEKHTGVGQIAGAARTFVNSISDLMTNSIAAKVQFVTELHRDSVVISNTGDQFASQFTWKSTGLVAQGMAGELEFNGLIRCSFGKEGVSSCAISFDACTPVRKFSVLQNLVSF